MKVALGFLWILVLVVAGLAQVKTPPADAAAAKIARGEYLVNNVANCIQCHTPRTADGEIDRQRLLQGAPIPMASPWTSQHWAVRAPHIAGLPGFSDEDVISLLTKGARLNGRRPQPPMPQYHLSLDDAQSILTYLRTLGVGPR
jgi:mono/diheme cytochrome c family protein